MTHRLTNIIAFMLYRAIRMAGMTIVSSDDVRKLMRYGYNRAVHDYNQVFEFDYQHEEELLL